MGRLFFAEKEKKNELASALVDINCIQPNRDQPRKNFDPLQIQKLADSIRQYGVIQPLAVRPVGKGLYHLIAGERRLRAAKLAGLQQVPCVILEVSDERSGEMALIENIHRQDLDLFEQAEAIESLLRQYGMTQAEVAEKLGMTQPTVANKLRLLKLTPEERKIIWEFRLTERHARALLRIQDEKQRLQVLTQMAESGMNVAQAEAFVESLLEKKVSKEREKKQRKMIIKDIRIFLNTIDSAVSVIKKAGYSATAERVEFDDRYELRISVPKEG